MRARTFLFLLPLALAGPAAAPADVVVVGDRQTGTRDCGGGSANVAGTNADLTLRGCKAVVVVGDGNRLDVGYVESLSVMGSGNRITWSLGPSGQRPKVANVGTDNTISEGSADAAKKSSGSGATATGAGGTSVTVRPGGVKVDAGGTSVNVGGGTVSVTPDAKELNVIDDGLHRTYDCKGGDVHVSGDRNELVLQNCRGVTVSGEGNKVDAGTAEEIEVTGERNDVTWKPGAGGKRPQLSDTGEGNRIRQGN